MANIFKRGLKAVKQAGRWIDSNILQNKYAAMAFPMFGLPYQYATKTGLFDSPDTPSIMGLPADAASPSITDIAVREDERKKQLRGTARAGSRKSAFLSNRTNIADLQDNIMGY